ncbi:MAG: 4Fe-4S cluster-binding domain-containing protein [Acutalibacteraceae bacterium]
MNLICNMCPRSCSADRKSSVGFCGVPQEFVVARAAKHYWEEPCISGKNGSGTVFFSGCNLRCVYCQNFEISHNCFGKAISEKRLMEIFDSLIEAGAHNINLVNPTHYAFQLAKVLKEYKSPVPIVYNSSGYESVQTLKRLEGLVDVYLPDLKYITADRAGKYSAASDYFEKASAAITEMRRQIPNDVFSSDGLLLKGLIIRHLILPMNTNRSLEIFSWIKETFGEKTLVSLMAQYTPCGKIENYPELQRKITEREYEKVLNFLEKEGFENAFVQQRTAANEEFIPDFDLTGV